MTAMGLTVQLQDLWVGSSYLSLVGAAVTLPIWYLLLRAIYRVTFHPLRSFPGPKLRAISHMPHALAGAKGKQAAAVKELHIYYGEVVRIAPDTLSFMTGQAWRDIYGHAATKKFKKYGYFRVRADAQPLLTVAEEDYARQRAALAHGFSERAIAGQETNVIQHVNGFVSKLEEKSKSNVNVDMSEWIEFLTFDVIGEFALSMHFGCVDNSKNHPWVALLANWTRAVTFAANATAFGLLTPFIMLFANIKDLKSIKVHLDQSAAKVRERLEMGEDPNKSDLWTYVLRNKGDKSLSLAEMEVNAAAILIAATAPVSDTLCGAVYLLAKNRDALSELRKEIESSVRGYDDITMSTTAKMPYLSGVVSETMRCYSPSPFGGKRLTPAGGATVSGTFVPGGTVVCVAQLPAFTLPNNFALPDSYLPNRWLPADHPDRPKVTLTDRQDALQPFSVGPKSCLGKGLALAEMKLILARFVWMFDFELLDDGFAIEKQKAFFFRERPPLNVRLSVRKH